MRLNGLYLAMRAYQKARLARVRLRSDGLHRWTGVRILGYHQITETGHDLAVTPDRFREQMELVLASGAMPIRLDVAVEMLEQRISHRYVCVTFDDGYYDNLQHALPILRELGIPATIFVPTAIIDGTANYTWLEDPARALTWSDITELVADELFDVQAHSCTHALLPKLDDRGAWIEIAESKRKIEQHVPYTVTSFCYPAGLYGEREARFVQEAGYAAGVTTDPGVNQGGDRLQALRRTLVYAPDDSAAFEAKLAGMLDKPPFPRAWLYRQLGRPT